MNRPVYVHIVVFLLCSMSVYGQTYFNHRFDFSHHQLWDGAINCIEVDDGYVLNGATGDTSYLGWHRIAITKFSLQGAVLFKKIWGDTNSEFFYSSRGSFLQHQNSYFYTIGSRKTYFDTGYHNEMMMVKYDDNFDTLWTSYYGEKQIPYDTSYIPRNFISAENDFLVTGLKYPHPGSKLYIFLIKTDSLGNVAWEKVYGNDEIKSEGMSVMQSTDNGYAIGAYQWIIGDYGAAVGDPIVIKTDSLGNPEWELNLGGPYQDGTAILCNSDDGKIFATSRYDTDSIHEHLYKSRIQLSKIDNFGNILWNFLYGDKSYYLKVRNIRPTDNNGVIISGSLWHPSPNEMGFLLRVDSLGNELWYRQYAILNGQNSLNYFYDAIPTSDGGFLGAGGCLPVGSDTGTQDAWVIKVDSLGCISPTDCWVGQEEVVWVTIETGNQLKIYPNPAQNWFEVEIGKNKESDRLFTIEVFDLFGRLTEEVEIPKGQNNIRLYVSDWKRGMYLLRVKNRNGVMVSGKIVIK